MDTRSSKAVMESAFPVSRQYGLVSIRKIASDAREMSAASMSH